MAYVAGDFPLYRITEPLDEIANYEYDIYGKEESATGTYDSPIRYTGQYYDAETGMYYLRAVFFNTLINTSYK